MTLSCLISELKLGFWFHQIIQQTDPAATDWWPSTAPVLRGRGGRAWVTHSQGDVQETCTWGQAGTEPQSPEEWGGSKTPGRVAKESFLTDQVRPPLNHWSWCNLGAFMEARNPETLGLRPGERLCHLCGIAVREKDVYFIYTKGMCILCLVCWHISISHGTISFKRSRLNVPITDYGKVNVENLVHWHQNSNLSQWCLSISYGLMPPEALLLDCPLFCLWTNYKRII